MAPRSAPSARAARTRSERGVALPSPVVLLSIVAVAMAAIAFLATQGAPPAEREVAIVARDAASSGEAAPEPEPRTPSAAPEKEEKAPPPVKRDETFVVVFNNSGITGLAGQVGGTVADAGWQVVGTDNWYGSVPESTVYFPAQLKRAGKQLALDLGVGRVLPAVEGMGEDRLTLILTGPLA